METKKATLIDFDQIVIEERIYDADDNLIGIETNQGRLMISHWEENLITEFENVEFKAPSFGDPFIKFIPAGPSLKKDGTIMMLFNYWRRGLFVKSEGNPDTLITRCYRHIEDEETEKMPLGKKLTGTVQIKRSFNTKTREDRIIINFIYQPGEIADKKVLIDGQKVENALMAIEIPGTNGKKIAIVPLKKK